MSMEEREQDGPLKVPIRHLHGASGRGATADCPLCDFYSIATAYDRRSSYASDAVVRSIGTHLMRRHDIIARVDFKAVLSKLELINIASKKTTAKAEELISEARRLQARYRVVEEELQWAVNRRADRES